MVKNIFLSLIALSLIACAGANSTYDSLFAAEIDELNGDLDNETIDAVVPPDTEEPIKPPGEIGPDPEQDPNDLDPNGDITIPNWLDYAWDTEHENWELWNMYTYKAIKKNASGFISNGTKDVKQYCPNFYNISKEDRILFFIGFIAELVKRESNFNYRQRDKSPEGQDRRGLLPVLDVHTETYGCPIQRLADMFKPELNLSCGMRVFTDHVGKYNSIYGTVFGSPIGISKVWPSFESNKVRTAIKKATSNYSVCKGAGE